MNKTLHKSETYWPRIFLSYGLFMILGMNLAATGPLLNNFVSQTGTNLKLVSWIFVIRSFGSLLSALVGVHLYDRKPVKKIMSIILILFAVVLMFIPLSRNIVMLLALFFITGFTHNMGDAGGNITVASSYKGNSGPLISLLHFTFGIGSLILPLLLNLFKKGSFSPTRIYWIIAALLLLAAVSNLFMKNTSLIQKKEKNSPKEEPRLLFLILLPLFFFFYTGTELALSGWIYNFSVFTGFFDEEKAALINSLYFGIFTGSRLLMVPLTTRFKSEHILSISLFGAFIVLILFAIFPLSPVLVLGGFVLLGLFLAPTFPVFYSMVQNRFGLTGKLTSVIMTGAVAGGMIFPWLIGQFIENRGPIIMIYILSLTASINLVLFLVLTRLKRKRNYTRIIAEST